MPSRLSRLVPFCAFGAFALVVSLLFFVEGSRATVSSLSADQFDILPMAAKRDNPALFPGDLIVGEIHDFEYYTPFFVNALRLTSLPDHDYLRGLNVLLLCTSLVYMFGWWQLFSVFGNRWLAAIAAFFARGILWPPGNELWGIAGPWTLVPRTIFCALLPFVLWAWFRWRGSLGAWLLTSLACGLLFNVHPVSGGGVALALVVADTAWSVAERRPFADIARRGVLAGVMVAAGMAPFVWTFFSTAGTIAGVDPVEFQQAMRMRLNPFFFSPAVYLKRALYPGWAAIILLPWIAALALARQLRQYAAIVAALAAFAAACLAMVWLPFALQAMMRAAGHDAPIAFQMIRDGKYMLIPSLLLAVLTAVIAARRVEERFAWGRVAVVGASCAVMALTLVARNHVFDGVPVVGDDVMRTLWPQFVSIGPADLPYPVPRRDERLDAALAWIRANTPQDARFVGPRQIRIGALRPVVHDFAGAVKLIEGNPRAFVEATRRERLLRTPEYSDSIRRTELMTSWGAEYWMTPTPAPQLQPIYANARWFVYDLRKASGRSAMPGGPGESQ